MDEQLRIILIIIVSVSIFRLLVYVFVKNYIKNKINHLADEERKKIYESDVIYGTNNEFAFDYLRDNMKLSLNEMVQRGFRYCIVDEVDSILIDEARTPLIISGPVEESSTEYFLCNKIITDMCWEPIVFN